MKKAKMRTRTVVAIFLLAIAPALIGEFVAPAAAHSFVAVSSVASGPTDHGPNDTGWD